jgi:CRISPR-associated protein Csh1
MINGVYQLGKLSLIDKDINDDLSIIIENPNIDGNYPKVLVINFEEKNDKVEYKDISLEEFSKNKIKKYAYRFGSANGGNLSPCMKLVRAKKDYEKNYKKNIKNFIKPFKYLIERNEEEKFSNIKDELLKKQEEIIEKFKLFLDVDNRLLLTVKINEKYIGEYETVRQVLKERYYNSYYKKHNTESRSTEKRCYICRDIKDEIFGFVNTYNFYTLDKKGFIAGGFNHKDAWKIYPVCRECSLILESGRTYIENKLKSKFAGLDFFVVPKSVIPINNQEDIEEYKDLIEKLFEKNKISLSNDKRREIMFNDHISFEAMSEMKNSLLYDIVFYKKSNAEYKILMLIEDVFPSRLSKLFECKKEKKKHMT